MGLAFPLGLLAGLLVGPLVLLYVLKLRRREVSVSSTLLWRRVLQERRANAPWEKLRRHLLLLLQLVALLLLVLALAGPFLRADTVLLGDSVLVLDVSASMAAKQGGGTRLDAARERLRDVLLSVEDGRRAALVLAGPEPRVVVPLSSERAVLQRALEQAEATDAPARLAEALQLARTLASGTASGEVVLVTDGAFDRSAALASELARCRILSVGDEDGAASANSGLVSLSLRPVAGEAGGHELFVGLVASDPSGTSLDVIVEAATPRDRLDPSTWTYAQVASEHAVVFAGSADGRILRVDAPSGTVLRVSARATAPDALATDDAALLVVPEPPHRRVLVVSTHPFLLERALSALPGVAVFVAPDVPSDASTYDVIVVDGQLPAILPDAPLLAFGSPGPDARRVESPRVVRWDVRHPALRHARLDAMQVESAWAGDLPPGASVVVEGDTTPLAVTWPAPGGRALAFRFDLTASDLPLRVAFPVILGDALDWLREGGSEGAIPTGRAVDLAVSGESSARLVDPAGVERRLDVRSGLLRIPPLERAGLHLLSIDSVAAGADSGRPTGLLAAALLSPEESDLSPRGLAGVTGRAAGEDARASRPGRRHLWPFAVLLAVGVLLCEWAVHHRRRE